MPIIKKEFIRRTGLRDAKLIVIASEGQRTEPKYFTDLKNKFLRSSLHVEILDRFVSASSPSHVLAHLNKFKTKYKLGRDDELWMVIDVDRWREEKLSDVAGKCRDKGFLIAVSNPCFELWLLLHLDEFDHYNEEQKNRLFQNSQRFIEREIRQILGSFNKSNLDTSKFLPYVENAVIRARILDINPNSRWPNSLGTRVYLLVEKILY
jgi:hypothetical protein